MLDWMPEAERDGRNWAGHRMRRNTVARRATVHWTVSNKNSSPKGVADYMWKNAGRNTGYHLLVPMVEKYKPLQLRPAGVGAGSLKNTSYTNGSPNTEGTINFQISMCCMPEDKPFTTDPGPWWGAVLDFAKQLGIPEEYVYRNWTPTSLMPLQVWYSAKSGWTAHKQVPETNHVRKPDPGAVVDEILWGGTTPPPTLPPEEDKTVKFRAGGGTVSARMLKKKSPYMKGRDVRQAQACLTEWKVDPGKHDGVYGTNTESAVRTFQKARDLTVDGIVGSKTWSKLIGG